MKKQMLLPIILLLTFALGLTHTPAAEEWVLHKTITKPGTYVKAIDFSVSGSRLIAGTLYNNTEWNVQVYDGNTFEYLHGTDYKSSSGTGGWITGIASRKGWYEAAVAGTFPKVHLYNTKSNITLKTFNTNDRVNALAYRPDGDRLAAVDARGRLYIFWTDHKNGTRRLLRTRDEHAGEVRAVAWSPNGSILATSGNDGTVRLWNSEGSVNYAVLRGHRQSVRGVAFSSDGSMLASGSSDGIRIWDANTERHLRTITHHSGVEGLVFHPSKPMLAVDTSTTRIILYNAATGQWMQDIDGVGGPVSFHPNGKFLAACFNKMIRIYKLVTANRLDANKDGEVDIKDLIEVAKNYGKTGTNNADVNNDNRVDIKDLTAVAKAINPDFAAPPLENQPATLPFTAEEVRQWIQDAKEQGVDAEGIATLEQLLQTVLWKPAETPPQETALLANYPNPFNPETWIPYQLAKPAEVTVAIRTADGKLVRTLALGQLPAGVYQDKRRAAYWDGTNEQGERVASGVYFYTLKAGDFSATKKMLIRK